MDCLKILRFWFPVFVYSGIIFYISSIPSVHAPLAEFNFDKIYHVLEYLPLGFLVARALPTLKGGWCNVKIMTVAVLLCGTYGFMDEYHQSFVVGRTASYFDALADVMGAFAGAGLFVLVRKKNLMTV